MLRPISQSELSTYSNTSLLKQSTPEVSRMHMQSPEQSRIVANAGDKFKLETTPVSGFSSIHEPHEVSSRNLTIPPRRFILSPGKCHGRVKNFRQKSSRWILLFDLTNFSLF